MKSQCRKLLPTGALVAPLAGAWIEMPYTNDAADATLSPPSRGRGLKF